MTIGGQLREWYNNNIADSKPEKYLEQLVEDLIEYIQYRMARRFSEIGIGEWSNYELDLVYEYSRIKKQIYKKYRINCSPEDFNTVFNKKMTEFQCLRMSNNLQIYKLDSAIESFYTDVFGRERKMVIKFDCKPIIIYWCDVEKLDTKFVKKYLKKYLISNVKSKLLNEMENYRRKNIIFKDKTFNAWIYTSDCGEIIALKEFADISDETIVKIFERISRREEIEMKAYKDQNGGYRIEFSISIGKREEETV